MGAFKINREFIKLQETSLHFIEKRFAKSTKSTTKKGNLPNAETHMGIKGNVK